MIIPPKLRVLGALGELKQYLVPGYILRRHTLSMFQSRLSSSKAFSPPSSGGKTPPTGFPIGSSSLSLNRVGNKLQGGISTEVVNLQALKKLDPTGNPVGGVKPLRLGGLNDLQELNLGWSILESVPP